MVIIQATAYKVGITLIYSYYDINHKNGNKLSAKFAFIFF